jgi:hypothetical protein
MSNPIDILKQIKAIVFNETPDVVTVEQKFDEYTLQDGTPVMVSELVIGGVVTLADGSAAPAGDHILADGTVISLGEGGLIVNISAGVAEPEQVMEVTPDEIEAGKDYEDKEKKMAEVEDRIGKLEAAVAKAEQAIAGLIALVETLVKEPSTAPVEAVKSGFKHAAKVDRADKIAKLFSNIKK